MSEELFSLDLKNIHSYENEEKLDMLPKDIIIYLFLNHIEKILKQQKKIDKARKYIEEHSTTIDYKTMKADYNLNMNDLLDILKGDNNG